MSETPEIERWIDAYKAMLSIAAWSSYQVYSAVLCGDPTPHQKEMYDRISDPQVGDIVLETGIFQRHLGHEEFDQLNRCLGVLLEAPDEMRNGHVGDGALVLSFAPPDDPAYTFWGNCHFIKVDTPPIKPDCPYCRGENYDNCPHKRIPFDGGQREFCIRGKWYAPKSVEVKS